MRITTNSCKVLVAVLFAMVLMPNLGWAWTSAHCPVEPSQTSIVSGETYHGSNCELHAIGDVDRFTFRGKAGDIWSMILGLGPSPTMNICLTLRDPTETVIAGPNCTEIAISYSTSITQKLTVGGTYTIDVTEPSNASVTYDLSLEGLSPTPSDAIPLVLNKIGTYTVTPPTAQDAFTFSVSTVGTFEITASLPSSATQNVCIEAYNAAGTSVGGPNCTEIAISYSVSLTLNEPSNGTYLVVASTAGNDATVGYNIELSCAAGICTQPPPKCSLSDSLSYDATSSTLTMNFILGTPTAATWSGWLVDANGSTPLSGFPKALPIMEPAEPVTEMQTGLARSGKVDVVSVLTTPTQGVTCSSLQTINTGTPQ